MKLTIEELERKVTIEALDGLDICEIMQEIRGLLIAIGYHPDSVVEGCEHIVEEYGGHNEKETNEEE